MFTTRLFAKPSFIEGVARILDFGHTLDTYNDSVTGQQADYEAIRSDWLALSEDAHIALYQAEQEFELIDE